MSLGIRNLKGDDSTFVSLPRRTRLNTGAPVRSIGTGSCCFAALKEDGNLVKLLINMGGGWTIHEVACSFKSYLHKSR